MNKVFFLTILLSMAMSGSINVYSQKVREFQSTDKNLKINQIQVLGTHNSYARPVDKRILDYADNLIKQRLEIHLASLSKEERDKFNENHPNGMSLTEGLKYDHPPFPEQLDAGLRSLEIDVYYDPTGNRFNDPAAYRILKEKGISDLATYNKTGLEKPGFKVLHISDIDVRSHYPTFKVALAELKKWSDANPDHVPIFIQLEAKQASTPLFQDSAEVLKFDKTAYDELDKEIIDVLGKDKLITPDQVRGKYKTLREAVLAKNWPSLKQSRGKIMFMLLASTAGLKEAKESPYVNDHPNLEDRAMFIYSQPNDNFAGVLLLDNSLTRQEDIKKYVAMGYIVRTRADIETYEAKVNDKRRSNAAFTSGAQVVSTDFYKPGNGYGTEYFVKIPGAKTARLNPVNGK